MTSSSRSSCWTETERRFIEARLEKPIDATYLANRQGAGGASLVFVPGNIALDLANFTFGFDGWSSEIVRLKIDFCDQENGKYNVGAEAIMRVILKDGTSRQDVGLGNSCQKNKAMAFESAKKEAVTDGLKRAFRQLGNGLGNCVYDDKYVKLVKSNRKASSRYRSVVPPRAELYHIVKEEQEKAIIEGEPKNKRRKLLQRPVNMPILVSINDRIELPKDLPLPAQVVGTFPKMSFQHKGWKSIVDELIHTELIFNQQTGWDCGATVKATATLDATGAQRQDIGTGKVVNQPSRNQATHLAGKFALENVLKRLQKQFQCSQISLNVSASPGERDYSLHSSRAINNGVKVCREPSTPSPAQALEKENVASSHKLYTANHMPQTPLVLPAVESPNTTDITSLQHQHQVKRCRSIQCNTSNNIASVVTNSNNFMNQQKIYQHQIPLKNSLAQSECKRPNEYERECQQPISSSHYSPHTPFQQKHQYHTPQHQAHHHPPHFHQRHRGNVMPDNSSIIGTIDVNTPPPPPPLLQQ